MTYSGRRSIIRGDVSNDESLSREDDLAAPGGVVEITKNEWEGKGDKDGQEDQRNPI
jgi:hypothetical protein